MSEWVTPDVIRYQFLDWNCDDSLEKLSSTTDGATNDISPVWLPRPLEKVPTTDMTTDIVSEESLNFPTDIWRLRLDRNEESMSTPSLYRPNSFCVRWMLHNLPTSHEYSMEVTFRRTQLSVYFGQCRPSLKNTCKEKAIEIL